MRRPTDEEALAPGAADLRIIERLKGNFAALNGLLHVRYFEGHFISDGAPSAKAISLDPITTEVRVLRVIRDVTSRGTFLSPSKNSADYAPTKLMREAELRGIGRSGIQRAIEAMLQKRELRAAHLGTGKNSKTVVVPADLPPLPGERDPLTGAKLERQP